MNLRELGPLFQEPVKCGRCGKQFDRNDHRFSQVVAGCLMCAACVDHFTPKAVSK